MSHLAQTSRSRQRIARLAKVRQTTEMVFLSRQKLLKGSVVEVLRTCGKPGCKCATGEKHICFQLSASTGGRTKTRNVPRKDLAKVRRLTADYRRFRQARAAWVRINGQIVELINQLEAARTVADFQNAIRGQKS